ncbi:MmcQ/YjbR family DNA-binding protein [Kribbella sp. NPDC051770]|uniref:MmcQ/YjbR family DNA-binding protein n=1 Tax=Kribbella sp. NPDC051770 TaxID=3155413 RepID=UPI00341CF627
MDALELRELAAACTDDLPGAELEHRSDPDWDLYKVGGKIFLMMTDLPGRPVVVVKAEPEHAEALRAQYADITPGYHMDKKHWITLEGGGTIGEKLVRELVTESYHLVVAGLPKRLVPVPEG